MTPVAAETPFQFLWQQPAQHCPPVLDYSPRSGEIFIDSDLAFELAGQLDSELVGR